jgi:hypothetical protein
MRTVRLITEDDKEHKARIDDNRTQVPDWDLVKRAAKQLKLDLADIKRWHVIQELIRKRVDVTVSVNMILEMPDFLDADTVVCEGSFDGFTVCISEDIKKNLPPGVTLLKDDIDADQITIEGVEINNEAEL